MYAKLMLAGWGGGLAEHIVVPTSTLYRLPDNVPLQIGGEENAMTDW